MRAAHTFRFISPSPDIVVGRIDFFSIAFTTLALQMHQLLRGYTLKVSFIVLLGRRGGATVYAYTHLYDQRQFEPRIRDHSPVTRSIFEIPSPSANAKVHSRVAHCRYDYFSFSFQPRFFLKCSGVSAADSRVLIEEISYFISTRLFRDLSEGTRSEMYTSSANLTVIFTTKSSSRFA